MKKLGDNAPYNFWARTAPEDSTVNNIGQLPCASASVLRYPALVLASVSASTALVTTLAIRRRPRPRQKSLALKPKPRLRPKLALCWFEFLWNGRVVELSNVDHNTEGPVWQKV